MTQRGLHRVGYIVQRWPPEGSLERELQRLISAQSIDTVVDIGAHVGVFGRRLRESGFRGRIMSFEPSPGPFARLSEQLDRGWEAHQFAVGDTDGVATLRIYEAHEEFTSLHEPTPLGVTEWGLGSWSTVDVPVRRLDTLAADMEINPRRTLIKIDTQGHDAAVLNGGELTMTRAAGLQIELPAVNLYQGAATIDELLDRTRSLGMGLLGMFPVHEHPRPLIPVEFDGLFARDSEPRPA